MPRGTKIAIPETAARKFHCAKSFIGVDGNDYLAKKDWDLRKDELYARCRGECELRTSPQCWGWFTRKKMHPHHLVRGRIGRHDGLSNLAAACWSCHRAAHPEKQLHWSKRVAEAVNS